MEPRMLLGLVYVEVGLALLFIVCPALPLMMAEAAFWVGFTLLAYGTLFYVNMLWRSREDAA